MRSLAALVGIWLFVAGAAAAEPASREIAFVSNAEEGTIALVDVATRKVVGRLDINPEHVRGDRGAASNYAQDSEVSPDGRTLYVSRGYVADLAAFDIATGRLLWKRPLPTARADHMAVSPDGRTIFIAALTDNSVYRVSTRDGEITGRFATGVWAHDTKFSTDGRRVYNSSTGELPKMGIRGAAPPSEPPGFARQLTIADPVTLKVMDRIELDVAFRPWAFTPDGRGLYAELSNQRAVVAYDLAKRTIVRRLELPFPPGQAIADWMLEAPMHGLALTRDGKTLCLAGRESNYVALVRAPQLSLITTVGVGDAPGWAEIADGGRMCLVTNARSNDLSFVSIPAQAEVARIPVGKGPRHVRVAQIPGAVLRSLGPGPKT